MALGKRSTTRPKVYKFVHKKDEYIQTNLKNLHYIHEDGWMEIDTSGRIFLNTTCYDGYAWDGCAPKFVILDLLLGAPDGPLDYGTEKPITYYASMTHDMPYQFKREVPLSRKDCDRLFYLILKDAGFFWSGVYYFMVRLFGSVLFPGWTTTESSQKIEIKECSWIEATKKKLMKITLPKNVESPFLK